MAAFGLAGLTLAVHATALGCGLSHLICACVLRLRDAHATPGGATAAGLGLTLAGAVLARTALTAAAYLRAVRRQPGETGCPGDEHFASTIRISR